MSKKSRKSRKKTRAQGQRKPVTSVQKSENTDVLNSEELVESTATSLVEETSTEEPVIEYISLDSASKSESEENDEAELSESKSSESEIAVETLEEMRKDETELNMTSVERPGEAEEIQKAVEEAKEQKAEEDQQNPVKHPRKWFHYLTRGAQIAVVVAAILVVGVVGFFLYEYSRLQKADPNAYTDEAVIASVEKDAQDESLQKSAEEMEKQMEDLEETEAVTAEGDIFQDDSVYNILLIGTDDRTETFSAEARGDTCILLSLNKTTGKVSLISFERGMGVPILWGPYEGEWDWLTHTFRYGGADMMVEEIRENFKVDVNRYVRINIKTLVKLVDAIGGIDVEVTAEEANHINNPGNAFTKDYAKGVGVQEELQTLTEGVNHMNGATAMVYARLRYIDDDWHRVVRQRTVIAAGAAQLSSLSAAEMIATLDAVIPLVQTNLTTTELANLLTLAPQFMSAEIEQTTIPASGTFGSMRGMGGRSMYAVDFEANAQIIRNVLYGVTDTEEEETEEEESESSSKYGNPYNSTTRSVDRSVTSSSSSSSTGASASTYSAGGVDNTIGEMVDNVPVDTARGDVSVVNEDGTITTVYADGTASTTSADGTTTVVGADGTVMTVSADGTITHQSADGTVTTIDPDGTVTTTQTETPIEDTTADSETEAVTQTESAVSGQGGGAAGGAAAEEAAAAAAEEAAAKEETAAEAVTGIDTSAQDAELAAQLQAQYEEQLAAQAAAAAAAEAAAVTP